MEDMNLRAEARWLILGGTLLGMTFLICLTYLAAVGKESAELSRLLNTGLNLMMTLLAGGAFWRGGRAITEARGARDEARTAAEQTNGQMDGRFRAVVRSELASAGVIPPTDRA